MSNQTNPTCAQCIGACCTAFVELPLTYREAILLQEKGTLIQTLLPSKDPDTDWAKHFTELPGETQYDYDLRQKAKKLQKGNGLYKLLSDCAFLDSPDPESGVRKCTIFDSSERPKVCGEFAEGTRACQNIRLRRGLF